MPNPFIAKTERGSWEGGSVCFSILADCSVINFAWLQMKLNSSSVLQIKGRKNSENELACWNMSYWILKLDHSQRGDAEDKWYVAECPLLNCTILSPPFYRLLTSETSVSSKNIMKKLPLEDFYINWQKLPSNPSNNKL